MRKTGAGIRISNSCKRMKEIIKNSRHSKHLFVRTTSNVIFRVGMVVLNIKDFLTDKQFREIVSMKLFKSERIHQTTPMTSINRYPVIFTACKNYFDGKQDIKILSFGCSTGEEVITLRQYFPYAVIVGAEINRCSLKICRERNVDDRIIFIDSTDNSIRDNGPYDAIFCMAVFQRTPQLILKKEIKSLKKIYPFEKFDRQICMLDECVKENGLMIVHFSQYDFQDTQTASKYDVLGDCDQDLYYCNSAIFDKDSKLIENKQRRYSIFIKKQ